MKKCAAGLIVLFAAGCPAKEPQDQEVIMEFRAPPGSQPVTRPQSMPDEFRSDMWKEIPPDEGAPETKYKRAYFSERGAVILYYHGLKKENTLDSLKKRASDTVRLQGGEVSATAEDSRTGMQFVLVSASCPGDEGKRIQLFFFTKDSVSGATAMYIVGWTANPETDTPNRVDTVAIITEVAKKEASDKATVIAEMAKKMILGK